MKTAKKIGQFLAILAMLAASMAIYKIYLAPQSVQPVEAQAKTVYQSAVVTSGDISNTATGSGSLIASLTANLGFTNNGTIAQLNVQAGDKVTSGQTLAVLDTIPMLKQAVSDSQLAVALDQKALDDLTSGAPAALAQAQSNLAGAEAALVTAQNNLHDPHDWRCPDNITANYYQQYLDAMVAARPWQTLLAKATPSEMAYYQMHLKPILTKMNQAYMNYQYCQAYTPKEITQSKADLQSAQASVQAAQTVYDGLKGSNGLDAKAVEIAAATLKQAQFQLVYAQNNLSSATLTAPFDGVVTAVNGKVGQVLASTGQAATVTPILTISKVDPIQIQANIDETDLSNIGVGCAATAAFTPLAKKTFTGSVFQIYPALVTVSNVKVVQILVNLPSGALASTPLPIGTDANIQVTCASVKNALLVPFQAIYENADGSTFVYMLNAQGQPEKVAVTIGIQTSISAEVKSGLKAGDRVVTSPVNAQ